METLKRLLIGCALTVAITLTGAQSDQAADAAAAFSRGSYDDAVTIYESMIDAGWMGADVYFNLATAHAAAGDTGRALLNYRRAALYLPRDPEITAQLMRLRFQRVDLLGDEQDPINNLADLVSASLNPDEMRWTVLILWTGFFLIVAAHFWRRGWRPWTGMAMLASGSLLVVVTLLVGVAIVVAQFRPAAVVISPSASVMSGPGDDYLAHFQIFEGAEVRVIESRGDWVRFTLPDGRQGWLTEAALAYVAD